MLVIRLRRGGKSHEPHYRIVVQEQRSKLNGKYIDSLGHFHPILKDQDKQLVVEKEKALEWIKKGAIPSVTVNNLLVKAGVLEVDKKISRVFSNKKKTKKNEEVKLEKTEKQSQTEEKAQKSTETEVTEQDSEAAKEEKSDDSKESEDVEETK